MTKPESQAKERAKKQPVLLSAALENKLGAYGVAAVAAGVGLLALTPPAEAKVIYTPAHVKILDSSFYLVLNREGIPDFVISNRYGGGTSGFGQLVAAGVGSNLVEASGVDSFGVVLAAALKRGARIPPNSNESSFKGQALMLSWWEDGIGGAGYNGKWRHAKDLYLGLKFQTRGKTHYGWTRVSLTNGISCEGILTGYAYETIPEKPIIAGRTKGRDVITVQPATLGHLAAGAPAIPAWRTESTSFAH